MKILITGANGFLGRRVVAAALARGHDVRAMVRPATKVDHLVWADQVELFRADLRAARDLPAALADVDVLIHLAAGVSGDDDAQFQSTAVATERLLDAMAATPTRKIVLASSFYVYDWSRIQSTLTEQSPVLTDPYGRGGYTIAKWWQERITREQSRAHGWDLCVMRPGFIWGPGNENVARAGQGLGPLQLVFGLGSNAALTHVDNCAFFFIAAAENETCYGETYNVFDGHEVSVWNYAGRYLRATRARRLRVPVPYRVGFIGTRMARLISQSLFEGKGKLPSLLMPAHFEARFKPLSFPNDKLMQAVGQLPPLEFDEAVERTFGALPQPPQPAGEADPQIARLRGTESLDTGHHA